MSDGSHGAAVPARPHRARAAAVDLEVGPATRAWVLRLTVLLAAAAAVALLGRGTTSGTVDTAGWVIGALAVAALVVAGRTFGSGAFLLGAATLLLRGGSPEPAVLAGAVLAVHVALTLATLAEALPLRATVSLAVLRRRLPAFAVAQGAGQLCAALAWAVRDTDTALPWLAVAALAGTTALAWWLLRGRSAQAST